MASPDREAAAERPKSVAERFSAPAVLGQVRVLPLPAISYRFSMVVTAQEDRRRAVVRRVRRRMLWLLKIKLAMYFLLNNLFSLFIGRL